MRKFLALPLAVKLSGGFLLSIALLLFCISPFVFSAVLFILVFVLGSMQAIFVLIAYKSEQEMKK